jgi:hypothetical protein
MPGGSKKGGGLEYVPFKMKGNPMKRNFGIGETESPDKTSPVSKKKDDGRLNHRPPDNTSPVRKKGLWEAFTGKKFRETKFATETKLGGDIVAAGDQIGADLTRLDETIKTGKATTPRKPASKSTALVEPNVRTTSTKEKKKKKKRSKKSKGNKGTFSEAFRAARKAQGPGGTFEYKGKKYTTDYANE